MMRFLQFALAAACCAACAGAPPTAPSPVSVPPPAAPSATLTAEEALFATMAANAPTPTRGTAVPLPTVPPTITLGPSPAPLLRQGWWDDAVCYEIFVRSFADDDGDGVGDFVGMTARLDYLVELGINCVWLMPVTEGDSYHGYDVIDYEAAESDYGTLEELQAFVRAARQRGIRVLVDLVLNHTGVRHPWFVASRDPASATHRWYLWSDADPGYTGPWGQDVWHAAPGGGYYYGVFWQGMPDLNYREPAVSAEAVRISQFWLDDVGVDGFRLDAVKHLIEVGREQENTRESHAWLREYAAALRAIRPDVFTVGEVFDGRPGVLEQYYPDQLDAFFEFRLAQSIVDAARYGDASGFRQALATAAQLPDQRYAPFLTNHDQERVMTTLGGDVGKMRIAATALLSIPGVPFLYYGEEIGMTGTKPDERLRTPMQWSAGPGVGFTSGTPWQAPASGDAAMTVDAQRADPSSLWQHYRSLIALHRNHAALSRGELVLLEETATRGAVAFVRQHGTETLLVVLNFAAEPVASLELTGIVPMSDADYRCTALNPSSAVALTASVTAGRFQAMVRDLPAHAALVCALEPR
jgi:alpha-amylase